MRKSILLLGFLLSFPARAELLGLEEAGADLRASLKIGGKDYGLPVRLLRSKAAAGESALLVDFSRRSDLTDAALARGLTVAAVDLSPLPAPARAEALRDLLPRLREKASARKVLARGSGETADALAAAGELFDGLLLQDASAGPSKAPRMIEVWGSDAYWRQAPRPATPAPEPANRRRYFLTGTAFGAADNCAPPSGAVAPAPALRALLVVLSDWTRGVKPPPSRVPAPADLIKASALVWPKIPGLPAPPADDRLVPLIDADGNERSGLRLPDRLLPIATFTGFAAAQKDPKAAHCATGAAFPFASTRAEREKTDDPRPSLVERYGSRAYFVATMRVVADKLVKERLLLQEDADAYVAAARQAPF